MPLDVTLSDACLRLVLAFVGACLVGFNRGERNEAAGMRTTILVCMAACIATLLANFLLKTTGKDQHYFSQIDVLRLPLGVLSGIGFIGAGAIIKKGDIALGVTTAATMWFMTVIGICFGAGRLGLGSVGVIMALCILGLLKWFDEEMPRAMRAIINVKSGMDGPDAAKLESVLGAHHYRILSLTVQYSGGVRCLDAIVQWEGRKRDIAAEPPVLDVLKRAGAEELAWRPADAP